MQRSIKLSRRRFLTSTGFGLVAFAGFPHWLRAMEGMENKGLPTIKPNRASPNFRPDVELEIIARPLSLPMLPGEPTRFQHYTARVLNGPKDSVIELPNSYLGPLLQFEKGQKIRIHHRNGLDETTIIHWHGLHVPAEMDGHPMASMPPGETYVYEFEMLNRASLNMYHPHTHEATARQVYYGMAGGILVRDSEERALGLPSGEYELPVVIQDRMFDSRNQLVYVRNMHDRMVGFYGDRILINGQLNASFDVASRAYRLRFLNGSNARIYKLGWDDGTPITVLGTDGGLLEAPVKKPYVMLAPGERLDVWADFSDRPVGSQLVMRSRPFSGILPKMAERMMHAGGGMGGNGLPMGSDYPLFTVRVTRKVSDSPSLPSRLSKFPRYGIHDVANANQPLPIGISEGPMSMLLNGRPYAPNDFLPTERVPLNTIQLMEIFHAHGGSGGHGSQPAADGGGHGSSSQPAGSQGMGHGMMGGGMGMGMMGGMRGMGGMGGMNHGEEKSANSASPQGSGMQGGMDHGGGGQAMGGGGMGGMGGMGMMMSMGHPIHLHGQYFQILSRTIGSEEAGDYATVREGFIDSGFKDTVLVMPGEKVRIIKPFQDFKGVFMFHCHNLEHEDMGMMREFLIE